MEGTRAGARHTRRVRTAFAHDAVVGMPGVPAACLREAAVDVPT